MKLGAHMSTSGGVWKALERGRSIGCEAVQIFVKSNMRWMGTPHPPNDISLFVSERKAGCFSCVFAHAGYLINLASPAGPIREHSIGSLVQEIELASALKLPYLVMHPGAHVGQGEATGFKQITAALDEVFRITRGSSVRIALENTAGQGSCLGNRFEHLVEILSGVKKPERLAVCLDTCHLFAAGYDIRTRKGWDSTMKELDSMIGLKQVVAFHVNDSKTDLGSRVDRHAHIGEGKIGLEGFRHVVNDPRFKMHPACLETPKSDDLHEDVRNLAVLRGLCGRGEVQNSKFETRSSKQIRNPKFESAVRGR
jgi:deoxyribonuclease-4